jgi:hypothetical protein
VFFFLKSKIKQDLIDQVNDKMEQDARFKQKLEDEEIDVSRFVFAGKNKKIVEGTKVVSAKEEYSELRKYAIKQQNVWWAGGLSSSLAFLCLLFVPVFQFLLVEGKTNSFWENFIIIVNFIFNFFFFLEVCWKNYAFGARKAWSLAPTAMKLEWFFAPLNFFFFVIYCIKVSKGEKHELVANFLGLVILLRISRLTAFLNELVVWRNLFRTLKALSKPFTNLTLTLYSLFVVYSAIGQQWFGGKIGMNNIDIIVK